MRAADVMEEYPLIAVTEPALEAARRLAGHRLPGLVVVDGDGLPVAVLAASVVVGFVVPTYVQDDPSLARVYDETTADACGATLAGRTVQDLLPPPRQRGETAVVSGTATVMECAAVMVRLRSSLVVVVDEHRVRGVITASRLLGLLLPPAS